MPRADIDLSKFQALFLEEAAELTATLETGLLRLAESPSAADPELLNTIFRAAHSIKGNAGMTGYHAVASFTHVMENVLDELRSGKRGPDEQLIRQLLEASDTLRLLLSLDSGAPLPAKAIAVQEILSATPKDLAEPDASTPRFQSYHQGFQIRWTPPADCIGRGADPIRVLQNLKSLGQIDHAFCDISAVPNLETIDPREAYLRWTLLLETRAPRADVLENFTFQGVEGDLVIEPYVEPAAETLAQEPPLLATDPAPKRAPKPNNGATIRVATSKLDGLFDLVGEVIIAQSMAGQLLRRSGQAQAAGFVGERLFKVLDDLERHTRDLQDRIMGLRMVPMDHVFRRFPRFVHDLAAQLGKKIQLDISGEETEIDRSMVEKLTGPLVHLIRNSADHGIESPEVRSLAGKPPHGRIQLRASCQSGHTIIEIADDGKGLDTEKIRAKAIAKGLISANAELSERRIHMLIFQPGFSTADTVTGISGRGVGMDAVRKALEELSGSIQLESHPGRGSKFTVRLPMTMAILDALLVRAAGSVIALPLSFIAECLRPSPRQLRTVPGESGRAAEVLVSRERFIPTIRLAKVFQLAPPAGNASSRAEQLEQQAMAVVIEHNHQQYALVADEILGQQQVVVKSLDTNYRRMEGLQGATILGDGQVALVADISGVLRLHERFPEADAA